MLKFSFSALFGCRERKKRKRYDRERSRRRSTDDDNVGVSGVSGSTLSGPPPSRRRNSPPQFAPLHLISTVSSIDLRSWIVRLSERPVVLSRDRCVSRRSLFFSVLRALELGFSFSFLSIFVSIWLLRK
ncbi:hypothetical protein ACB092_01G282600 [Castanea dentata]